MADLDRRLELQEVLEAIAGKGNVYFQPGSNITMKYPAIVYSRDDMPMRSADDDIYARHILYKVVVIDKDPDSALVELVAGLPTCRFNTHYTADGLNHDVFTIFY